MQLFRKKSVLFNKDDYYRQWKRYSQYFRGTKTKEQLNLLLALHICDKTFVIFFFCKSSLDENPQMLLATNNTKMKIYSNVLIYVFKKTLFSYSPFNKIFAKYFFSFSLKKYVKAFSLNLLSFVLPAAQKMKSKRISLFLCILFRFLT